ncbi:MAG TPA: Holliday junction branch migration protein RuvA [Firmicutes bacterium]|nr:Holliday junction branch migration protein RuvA [Bacillota bacterium]
MIASVSGLVRHVTDSKVLLEAGPVVLELTMPAVQCAELRHGELATIHTHFHFSSTADVMRLYGFTSQTARELFATLITGSGVGPRVALALLELGVGGLVAAVRDGDERALTSVPGVGPKLAKKIVVELSEKVGREFSALAGDPAAAGKTPAHSDAVDAVVSLGYGRLQAEQAVAAAGAGEEDPAEVVRRALAWLSKAR